MYIHIDLYVFFNTGWHMFEFPWPTRKRFGANCSQTETGQLPKVERVRLVKSDFEQVALAGFCFWVKNVDCPLSNQQVF